MVRSTTLLSGPLAQGTRVALIRPDEFQPGKSFFHGAEHQFRPLAVMQARRMDHHLEQQPQCIHEQMALAAPDLLASLKPARPTLVGPDGLAIDDRGTRGRVSSRPLTSSFPQTRMDPFPGPIETELPTIVIH